MRTAKRTRAKAPATKPIPVPFTFQCTACETVEHRRTPALPEGWATEELGTDIYAFCPECAPDLPNGSLPKGSFQ